MEYSDDSAPAAHVVCRDYEHCGKAGHGYIIDQRHHEQEYEQEHQCVDNAGHRSASAIGNIGHGAGDGACDRYAAEERNGNVGDALAYEFGVGIGA